MRTALGSFVSKRSETHSIAVSRVGSQWGAAHEILKFNHSLWLQFSSAYDGSHLVSELHLVPAMGGGGGVHSSVGGRGGDKDRHIREYMTCRYNLPSAMAEILCSNIDNHTETYGIIWREV